MGLIKNWGLLLLLVMMAGSAQGQTWNEFFRQKKTQRRYLARQIAALKLYGDCLEKGYEIARGGLSLVRDVTGGEFSLHKDYFSSLGAISPAVKQSSDILAIIALQRDIVGTLKAASGSDYLHPSDKEFIDNVREALLEATLDDLDQLLLVVTADQLELTDGQRLQQLKNILYNIRRKAALARELAGHVELLVRQRKREQANTEVLNKIYGLNQ